MSIRFRIVAVLRLFFAFGLAITVIGGIVGQVVRDPSAAMAILFYLPLLPASAAAVVIDVAYRGRSLGRARFLLTVLGIAGFAGSVPPMIGSGATGTYGPTDTELTMLHWNVQWGGGPFRSQRTWAAQRAEIEDRDPDLIILSELPPADWLELLVNELGPEASCAGMEHDGRSRDWFRLGVCSRWPLHQEKLMPLPGGVAMSVACEVRDRRVRLLVVDGKSNPFASRLPFLQAISDLCQAASAEGRPFDAVAGDFNTPGRSIGFDALVSQGYKLASRSAAGWRGTFPSWLPIYDIDHIWLGPGLGLRSCTLFNGVASDHRGQFVSVILRNAESPSAGGRREHSLKKTAR